MIRTIKSNIRSLIGIKSETDYYSQGGEDAIVSKTFSFILPTEKGFYIDIGAYHPFKHSNTYLLYKMGWRGMNVDPRPGFKELFDRHRVGDINVEAGVGAENGNLTYYILDEGSTMNSFSRENLERLGIFERVKRTVEIPVFTLAALLEKHAEIKAVDYLNIDAEGFEMEIIAGLDAAKIKPKVISIEQNDVLTFADVLNSTACKFLADKGFTPYAKNVLLNNVSTVFYIRNDCAR